jgi:hypothetical protein
VRGYVRDGDNTHPLLVITMAGPIAQERHNPAINDDDDEENHSDPVDIVNILDETELAPAEQEALRGRCPTTAQISRHSSRWGGGGVYKLKRHGVAVVTVHNP